MTQRKYGQLLLLQLDARAQLQAFKTSIINPGHSEQIKLRYKSSNKDGNDQKITIVEIKSGPHDVALTYRLVINAMVRRELSVTSDMLDFGIVTRGISNKKSILIANYGSEKFNKMEIKNVPKWVESRLEEVSPETLNEGALQYWKLDCRILGDQLSPGPNVADLTVEVEPQKVYRQISLRAQNKAFLKIVPDQIFLTDLRENQRTEKSLLLFFSQNSTPMDESDFRIVHDLGEGCKITLKKVRNELWKLDVAITPTSNNTGMVFGNVEVHTIRPMQSSNTIKFIGKFVR